MYMEVVAWQLSSTIALLTMGVAGCCCSGTDSQQQQQQQVVIDENDSEPKRVCPECGIENPNEASYCGDCGYQFK